MSSRIPPALALAACLGVLGPAFAAGPPPDPADARLSSRAPRPTPPAAPSSAAVADPGVGDWRAANRRVHEAGGWRALLRESQAANAPTADAASAPAPAPKASAASAAGHHPHAH